MKCLFTLLIVVLLTSTIYSQPGTIDPTFGNNGFASASEPSTHNAVVQQPDGKLLTAGGYTQLRGANIERFLSNGDIDSLFGTKGFATIGDLAGGSYDILLQPDNMIVVVGSLTLEDGIHTFVARFKTDGTIDSSFGSNGIALIPDFGDASGYDKIVMEKDGSFLLNGAGQTNLQNTQPTYSLLCHLLPDGAFDYSFGNGGRALNKALISTNNGALALQPDGKILQAGFNEDGGDQYRDYVLCRYNSDGALDNTWGDSGVVITQGINGEDVPKSLVVQPDGRIVMGGYSGGNNTYYMTAIRYNANGILDNSFGKEGKSFVSFPGRSSYANTLLLQPDGKLILAGQAVEQSASSDLALCRLNTDGSLDSSFGINGKQLTPYSGSQFANGYCAALQSDGKIVIGGSYFNNERGYESYLLARYNGDDSRRQIIATRIKRWLQHHGISWQMDNNVRYYNVQSSNDGGVTYQPVAKIYNNHQTQYNYEDAAGKSNDLYRVAAVGKDGSRSYSNSVLISSESSVSVFPNPVRSTMQLQGLSTESKTSISIVDFTGNVRTTATANGSSCSVNTSNLQPGNYFIKIETNKIITTQPFVKE